jgi:hypothetical protein
MIAIHQDKIKSVQSTFQVEIEDQRRKALKKLKKINKNQFNRVEKDYLISVINLFEMNSPIKVIECSPSDIEIQIVSIGIIPGNSRFYANGRPKKTLKSFILQALNYTNLRGTFYPKYFREIGIKACVYCNSQLTITAKKTSSTDYSSKFDVDHYHSKDKYPFLSISLFNLYPACTSCNRAKKTDIVQFDLYTEIASKTLNSEYRFKLSPYSKSKYLITKDSKEIEFTFEEPTYTVLNAKTFKEVFHIEGIYKTQDDLIEELIIKSQIYNKAYLKILKSNFSKLSLHPKLFKRTLIGNYADNKDLHKRPMSKLVMDIAKDLDLI